MTQNIHIINPTLLKLWEERLREGKGYAPHLAYVKDETNLATLCGISLHAYRALGSPMLREVAHGIKHITCDACIFQQMETHLIK